MDCSILLLRREQKEKPRGKMLKTKRRKREKIARGFARKEKECERDFDKRLGIPLWEKNGERERREGALGSAQTVGLEEYR